MPSTTKTYRIDMKVNIHNLKQQLLKYKKLFSYIAGITIGIVAIIVALMFRLDYRCAPEYSVNYCKIGAAKPSLAERFIGIVPEKLQVWAGSKLSFVLGAVASQDDTKLLSNAALKSYANLSSEWNNTPSALSDVYAHWAKLRSKPDQYYAVQTKPGKKVAKVVVFFHGYGGNFQIYTNKLQQHYEQRDENVLILSPSFKSGAWTDESTEFVDDVIRDASQKFAFTQTTPIRLLGLSNGGLIIAEFLHNTEFKAHIIEANLFSTFISKNDAALLAQYTQSTNICLTFGTNDQRIDIFSSLTNIEGSGVQVQSVGEVGHELFLTEHDLLQCAARVE